MTRLIKLDKKEPFVRHKEPQLEPLALAVQRKMQERATKARDSYAALRRLFGERNANKTK